MHLKPTAAALALVLCAAPVADSAEIILPQGRTAFFSREPIEIAVAGLAIGTGVDVCLVAEGAEPVTITVGGAGTQTLVLPPNSLAPGDYSVSVNGEPPKQSIKVRRGIHRSTMYVSQTGGPRKGLANFSVSNAFGFGLLDGRTKMPVAEPRGRMSGALRGYDKAFADDVPFMVYMYWTGYVLHKPWGSEKEWCSPDMTENMRLFNYHVAQRVRPYAENILYIGSLDEPGLPWGKTAAGGSASGFAGWNTKEWYAERGWTFTDDPGGGSDEAWIKYVDIPSTHVFVDWGYGKVGALTGLYFEKCHDPASKAAHAMNGQLFNPRVPQPHTRHAYHLWCVTQTRSKRSQSMSGPRPGSSGV